MQLCVEEKQKSNILATPPDGHRVVPAERDADAARVQDVCHGHAECLVEATNSCKVLCALHAIITRAKIVRSSEGYVSIVFDVVSWWR